MVPVEFLALGQGTRSHAQRGGAYSIILDGSFICSFLGTGDDFREYGLFGLQTHSLPWSTYDDFMYILSEEIQKADMNQAGK